MAADNISMFDPIFEFMERHSSLILTTHDPADADGLGAELVFALIAKSLGKNVRIINSEATPHNFRFIDPDSTIEIWADAEGTINPEAALVLLDTSDEYHIGNMRNAVSHTAEVFFIDHHEPNVFCTFKGFTDNTASSTCEIIVELAHAAGLKLGAEHAAAAYTGIVFDTGFFAYPKTTHRTFSSALPLIESGVNPYEIYNKLKENDSTEALLLQKKVLSTLKLYNRNRVAVQILKKEDLESTGAHYEDAENFINIPLKSKEIQVSILVKQNKEGLIRCSLRSKGSINVSKIAQSLGGGGHVSAAGFKSSQGIEDTLETILANINQLLDER